MKFSTQAIAERAAIAFVVATILVAAFPMRLCAEQGEHAEESVKLSAEELSHAGIEIATAGGGRIASMLDLPGQIVLNADSTAHVVAQFDGTVREVRASLGTPIKASDVVAVIDSRELADLSATYLSSSTRLELALLTLKREQALWEQKISAEQDYLAAKHAYAEAQIEQRQAKQKLKAYGIEERSLAGLAARADANLARFEIKAPVAGVIIAKDVTLGETVAAGDKLFEIADLSSVWLDISVFPKDVSAVAVGQVVRVSASGIKETTSGSITYIQPLANTTSRAVLARVLLNNPDGQWRPGLFVTASAITAEADVSVVVAKDALQSYEAAQVAFVETPTGLTPRPVTLGRSDDVWVEILSGLQLGERYVAKNSFVVKSELSKGESAHEH